MWNNTNKRRILLSVAGAVAVIAALVVPHVRARMDLYKEMTQLNLTMVQAERNHRELDRLNAEIDERQDAFETADRALPKVPDIGGLLEQLSAYLAEELVIDQKIEAKSITRGSDFNRIALVVEFRGSANAMYGVLKRIDAYPRLIRVDHVEIQDKEAFSGEPLRVQLHLSAFFCSPEEASDE